MADIANPRAGWRSEPPADNARLTGTLSNFHSAMRAAARPEIVGEFPRRRRDARRSPADCYRIRSGRKFRCDRTTDCGTAMRTPGKRRVMRRVRSRCRAKARPRALPPSEPVANLQKSGSAQARKLSGLKIADQRLVLFPAIVRDRFDQIAAQMFRADEVGNSSRAKLLRQGEFGARHQPVRKVIALRCDRQTLFGGSFCSRCSSAFKSCRARDFGKSGRRNTKSPKPNSSVRIRRRSCSSVGESFCRNE